MTAMHRRRPWWLEVLLGACLAALPSSTACPRLCACYVPTEVHCTFRYFTAVPPRIPPNVERINLGYNSLLKLTETDFAGLEKLELLMLHSNEINAIPDKAFTDLHSLQVLKMSYNKVSVLQQDVFYGLKSLVRLHMDHNKIEIVNPNVFYGLTSLRLVHLEGNSIKQLHPDTFVTLNYVQIFKISSIKHIYLSENALTSLPQEMFSYMSELESIYLHGNPWSCDCSLQWFAEWSRQRPDVIKCKKDRSSGAQQCPVCASPQNYKGRNFVTVPSASLTCTKPVIHHSLKFRNLTVPDDGDFSSVSTKDFMAPIGSMVLNMTDQAGSRGNLVCNIQKPKEMSPLSFDKDGNNTILKTSFTAFLVCDIAYEHIQQLWSILALYSNFPLKLERNALATKMPFTAYRYKQIYSEKDELHTNVEAELRAEPPWLMQSKVALQLDRTATTLNTLHIQYFTDAQIILPSPDQKKVRNNWTIISRDNKTQTQHTVLVGGTVELDCQAIGDPAPAIEWILADGSKVRAPYISEDGRIIVVKTGTFTLRTADTFDTGLYHCIGTNYNDADILTFRITVVDPYVEHSSVNGAHLSTSVGSTLYLPCTSAAVPDAAISWVLPERVILHHSARNKHIFDNGTLRIQGVTEQDSGYFRCVAANQYGVDLLVLQVLVRKDKNTPQKMQVAVGEWEESDGSGNAMLASARRHTNPSATLAPLIANEESAASASRNQVTQSAYKRHSYGKPSYRHYRDKMGRRFRGQRRQFVSSARRVDPQRWAAFLEKTKRNSTLVEKQEVEIKPAIQGRQQLKAPVDEEETSGDLSSPEQEFMIPVTESATASPLGKATPSVVPAGRSMPTSNGPAGSASLLAAEAVAPLPSPSSQSVSSDSRRPQTYLNPTITNSNSWERSALSQISANVIKQSTQQRLVSPGESPSQQLNPVSSTPTADVTDTSKPVTSENTVGKLHLFTESANKISTKTDHRISAAIVSEPNPETGHVYLHSTQKPVITKLPLGSNTIAHQKIQIIQDVTTHAPQQQYGRRRKISGRRKIVRPGRIPNMKEHRYHFGKQDSVRGNTAPGVLLTSKYTSDLPTLNNLSSSINLVSPEAPLPSPSTMNMSLEHPAGAVQNAALPTAANSKHAARQRTTSAVMPFFTKSTQDTPQQKSETSAPFQTSTYRVQPFSTRPPTTTYTAHVTAEIAHTVSTKIPPTLESVSSNTKSRASSKNSQGGKITGERLFGNDTQKEVLEKLPEHQTDVFPSTEVSVLLPKTTAALPTSKISPLPFTPISVGGDPSSGFLSLNKSVHYDNGKSGEHLPTAELHSHSSPAASTTEERDVASLKPTVIPIVTPQTDTKITKSKILRVGRKRGQRRKRPPKTSTSRSLTTGHSTTAVPPGNTAVPAVTTVKSAATPAGLTPAQPLPESARAVLVTEMPVPWSLAASDTAQHMPTAAKQTSATPSTRMNIQSVTLPPSGLIPQTPTTTTQTTPLLSKPFSATSTQPTPVGAGSKPAQQIKATTTAGEMEKKVTRENHVAQPTFPGRSEPSAGAPAATGTAAPRAQHPAPLPAPAAARPPAPTAEASSPPIAGIGFRQKPPTEGTERGKILAGSTLTVPESSQTATPCAPPWGRDKNNPAKGRSDKRQDQETTTRSPISFHPLSRNHFAKPRIIGGKLAAFTVLANSDAFIPCEAVGNPQPTIQWTKISSGPPAAESPDGGRWTVFANGTLSITRAGLQDRGQYLCSAGSPLGTARLLVTLSVVAYPPRIAGSRPRLLTAHSGKAVAMKCQAEGRPPPTVSWVLANKTYISSSSKENRRVHVQPDGTLIIEEVTVYDRGLYTCMAKNPAGTDMLVVKLQVIAAPPVILEEKRQQIAGTMGESLKFPCTVEGNPHPSVHWVLFDGTVVKPLQFINAKLFLFPNGTLHLSNLAPSDSGNYECIATSSTGSERRVVSLLVEQRDTLPKIAAASQEMTRLNFGDKLLLNCTATGEPKPRIIWRLPSKAVVDQWHRMGSRIHVYPNGSLAIEAVTEKDAGDYLCVARNKIGDDLILMKVSITMKPAKIDQKQYFKKLVPYGKDFKVDCKASGSPAPEISWSLPDGTVINNVMLADDSGHRSRRYVLFDNGTLYLNKVGITEEGDYTCYAQNTLGRDEMKIHITVVTTAAQIKHSYKTYIKVKAGDTALLDCEVVGEPKPKIFWLLPSSDMISSSTDRYFLHANGSLSVSQVKLLDAGEYMCVARNAGGDDTKLFKLDVEAKPPIINGLYTNKTIIKVTAVRHSKKQIDCRAEGTPPPQIMWIMPDNIFLTAPYYGSRIVVYKNGTLEIRNLRPSDTADFICVARNDWGESMLVVRLEVLEMLRRPMFKNPFNEKIIAKPGKATTLNCSVDGNPPPEISWMLPNGTWFSKGIKTSQFLTGSNGTLTIYNPNRDKAGKYRCAAKNKVGYIERLIILEIGQKPSILVHPKGPVKGISGESLSLHCLSDGSPKPNTAWTLPGGFVLDRPQINRKYVLLENGTLVIREASIHDRGNYVCKAHNNAGESSLTVPVIIVAYPPRITNRPPQTVHTMPGAAVQLTCMALGIPKPEIMWELPDHSILSTGNKGQASRSKLLHPPGTLVIQDPRPSDSGMYKCTAKNHLGSDFTVTYIHVI
nr:immunoglobulin superfamily member 10 isoform X1 [Anas platyrhynchos]XP_027320377.2 immunoglobulin superfamily member 10 isoform X1 [Anas platyrhynchos]XP_027320378.2 immunoglobulin superfamily member 10 isoform X1 [Anas platyrhynchos]XP_027320379.2 immunoglobulin superfamily member 10 isoform X1 [Anas platyrhynchos]XP_038039872.1 immunoglobulin superfamily member 10 isoform X1 [Anas platyrhynchos]XP_038039873.1 immunoglobulin superfamily member 10 isoform X1 [Anas platyrhynchos]XP_03803987